MSESDSGIFESRWRVGRNHDRSAVAPLDEPAEHVALRSGVHTLLGFVD
jgi:hypothetical protein